MDNTYILRYPIKIWTILADMYVSPIGALLDTHPSVNRIIQHKFATALDTNYPGVLDLGMTEGPLWLKAHADEVVEVMFTKDELRYTLACFCAASLVNSLSEDGEEIHQNLHDLLGVGDE